MKKVFKILTTLFVLIGLTACSNATQSGASISTNPGNGGGSSNGGGSNGGGGSNLPVTNVPVDNMFASKVTTTFENQNVSNRAFTNIDGGKLDTITYFDGKTNKPYIFNNEGTNVLLGVADINKISDSIIAVKYDAMYPVIDYVDGTYVIGQDPNPQFFREAILDLDKGTLTASYDYDLEQIKYYDGKLYGAGKNPDVDRLYEINPSNMTGKTVNEIIEISEPSKPSQKIPIGHIHSYTDNYYFYETNKMLVLEKEKVGFNVRDIVFKTGDMENQVDTYSIHNAPRIYEKTPTGWKVSFAGVNLRNDPNVQLNIICFLQEDINKPIYAMYSKEGDDNVYIGKVNIGGEVTDGIKRPDCKYFSWNISEENPVTEEVFNKNIFKITTKIDDKVRQFEYPCFYQKQGSSNRYVQEPTKFFQSSNVRIVDYLGESKNVFEITFVGGVPTVNKNTNITVANIPWTNYESCITEKLLNGSATEKQYFKDNIEMIGNDVYYENNGSIYKNDGIWISKIKSSEVDASNPNKKPKSFYITKDSIIYTSSTGTTHSVSLEGKEDSEFAKYDIGVKKFVNFDKPVVIKTAGLSMNGGDKEADAIFEKAFGENQTWVTYYKSIPQFPGVTFTLTDHTKNMAQLIVGGGMVPEDQSLSHYEIGRDNYNNPLLKILSGEKCTYFKLSYLGNFKEDGKKDETGAPIEESTDPENYVIKLRLNFEKNECVYAFKKQVQ